MGVKIGDVFYTYYKLQGSQTELSETVKDTVFYTYYKLQGSQTRKQS